MTEPTGNLDLGPDDESDLLPDHLVPEPERVPVAPKEEVPPGDSKAKAIKAVEAQLMFAEFMASRSIASKGVQSSAANQAPATPQPTASQQPGSNSGSSNLALEPEKAKGLKVPKFLKKSFEVAGLKSLSDQLFASDEHTLAVSVAAPAPQAQSPDLPISSSTPTPSAQPTAPAAIQGGSGTAMPGDSAPTARAKVPKAVKKTVLESGSSEHSSTEQPASDVPDATAAAEAPAAGRRKLSKEVKKTVLEEKASQPAPSSPAADDWTPFEPDDEKDLLPDHLVPEGDADHLLSTPAMDASAAAAAELAAAVSNFSNMVKGTAKISKEAKRTVLDQDFMRKVAKTVKEKEEERIKWDLQFKSEPGVVKPACPVADFVKASECPVKWSEMSGQGRVKYCDRCSTQVYDLQGLDEAEAKELVVKREGRPDLVYYRRSDGKWQVKDCPVGAQKNARLKVILISAAAAIILVIGLFIFVAVNRRPEESSVPNTVPPVATGVPNLPAYTPPALPKKNDNRKGKSEAPPVPDPAADCGVPPSFVGMADAKANYMNLFQPPSSDGDGVMSHPYIYQPVQPPAGSVPQPGKAPYRIYAPGEDQTKTDRPYIPPWERQ